MERKVECLGVIGAGTMGRGIAQAALSAGFAPVVLVDPVPSQLEEAEASIRSGLAAGGETGRRVLEGLPERLRLASSFSALAECDFVIEAVPEDFLVKEAVFREAAGVLPEGAVIASNTSSLPITRLAAVSGRPESFAGLHFMNPAPKMKGVEVIPGVLTAPEVLRLVLDLAREMGKEPVLARDCAGFVVNRLLIPALDAAAGVLRSEGIAPTVADAFFTRSKEGPRHRMGPLMLADLIGLDVVRNIMLVLEEEFGPAYAPDPLVGEMVSSGRLGAKSGSGFYRWEAGRPRGPAKEFGSRDGACGVPVLRGPWLVMVNEAFKVVERGIAVPAAVERACRWCLNHPEGILSAADGFGLGRVLSELAACEERWGLRFKPAPLLRRLCEAGFSGGETGKRLFVPGEGKTCVPDPVFERFLEPLL